MTETDPLTPLELRTILRGGKPVSDHVDPRTTTVKPGWTSTEVWLTVLAQVISAVLYTPGLLSVADPVQAKILMVGGIVLSVLSILGIQVQRGAVKITANRVAGEVAVAEAQLQATQLALAATSPSTSPPAPSP